MKKLLLHNAGLKLASLLLAFVLWFLVVRIGDPQDAQVYNNVKVKLVNTELLEKEGKVYEILDDTDTVNVTIKAPKSIINKLQRADIVAEADVSKLTDINTIAITYYVENANVISVAGSHDAVRLNVEDKKSKWIRLAGNTVGDVAEGYIISDIILDQSDIEITGPESAVDAVSYAGVDISVEGASDSLTANVDIQLYDADGNHIDNDNLKKNVNFAYMTVEVLAAKEVPVKADYTGEPKEGYLDTGVVELDRSVVQIAGTAAALAEVKEIVIPESRLDITERTENLVSTIKLKEYLPENIKLADKSFDGRITATVYIEPVVTKELQVLAANIQLVNVPEHMQAQLTEDITSYTLKVSGLNDMIRLLQTLPLNGTVDVGAWMEKQGMEQLTPGIYNMPVAFQITDKVTASPLEVTVVISGQEENE